MRRSVLAILCALTLTAAVRAENWPQFRGVHGGVAPDDPALPDTWSATENVVWKLDVPGYAWSSPIVWGDHVFVTSAVNTGGELPLRPTGEYLGGTLGGKMTFRDITTPTAPLRWMLYDVDFKTGKIRWQQALKESAPGESRHEKNSYASETPVTDGQRVYVYFSYAGLFAFDMTGKQVWSKPMTPHKTRTGWGNAASPVLAKDRIVIVNDNEEASFIAAYSTANGNELWRIKRDEASNWASPFVWENPQRTEIITKGTKKIRSYSLDGTLLWELAGIATLDVPTPFANNGLLYVESGYPTDQKKITYAIRPGAKGDITLKEGQTSNDFIVWSQQNLGTYATSTLVYGDYYYTLLDRGMLLCHDARTGKEIYGRQRVTLETTGFTASPWAYNGKIFALSEDGDTFVMQAGPEFKVLGKNSLGELALATPAIANGSLIIRTASHLYRIARSKA
jgi:outer membrane protein assembly factor BamB